jgi:caffeoyl-CoA O-methyltransferase
VSKFTSVDERLHRYLVEHGTRQDEVLRRVEEETAAMGKVSDMQIAPDQGAFMTLLARASGAKEALELGTFTGYSAICIARGLAPGGRLVCCELSEEYAEIAARNFADAGVADRIEIRLGPAAETLAALPDRELFDFVFIDADKAGYPEYYEETVRRTRPGGLILLDNVLGGGVIAAPDDEVPEERRRSIAALRAVNDTVVADERVDLAMVAVADGVTIARKR